MPQATPNKMAEKQERRRIVKYLVWEGFFSGTMVNTVTGVLLIKFALELGASPFEVGLLAAIPFFALFMQIPAVLLLAKFPYRKRVSLMGSALYRLALLGMVFTPFIENKTTALYTLIGIVMVREGGLGWATGPWYSWVNDLVHARFVGRTYGARLRLYTISGTLAALSAGLLLDFVTEHQAQWLMWFYSAFFLLAFLAGLLSMLILLRLPERPLDVHPTTTMLTQLAKPFEDANFRRLLAFMFCLLFAVNIAVPFFPYYMFTALHVSASYVAVLWAVMQLMQLPFFKWWGFVGDRFSHVTALAASVPFFIVSLLFWPFVAWPEVHTLSLAILVVIHLLMGVGLAGVTLATQVIAMRLAPKKWVTGYTSSMSLAAALSSGLGALFGGAVAHYIMPLSMQVKIEWYLNQTTPQKIGEVTPFVVTGFEFLFLLAALLAGLSMPLLRRVVVKGSVSEELVLKLMATRALSLFRNSVTGPGVRGLVYTPLSLLLRRGGKP